VMSQQYDVSDNLEIITEVFGQFMADDADCNGQPIILTTNITAAMEALGLDASNQERLSLVLQTLDPECRGFVEFEPFAEVMSLYLQQVKSTDNEVSSDKVMELFKLFTRGKDRPINLKDLKRISDQVKDGATEQELRDMLYLSGKNQVDLQSFEKIIKSADVL
jgi:Ca2+-binding EF-hand superfamily protein